VPQTQLGIGDESILQWNVAFADSIIQAFSIQIALDRPVLND